MVKENQDAKIVGEGLFANMVKENQIVKNVVAKTYAKEQKILVRHMPTQNTEVFVLIVFNKHFHWTHYRFKFVAKQKKLLSGITSILISKGFPMTSHYTWEVAIVQ